MTFGKTKRYIILIAFILCAIFLSSCGLTEMSDRNNIRETMDAVEKSINSKDSEAFKTIFSLSVAKNISELDIEKVFDLFSSGITCQNTDSENYPGTYESIEGDDYVKNLEWHKEIVDNATKKEYIMIINVCAKNWNDDSAVGMKYIIFYNIEQEVAALDWLHSVDEEEIFEGIYIYGE
jgi:hypothetical protein